jgi:predicted ATPase
LVEVADKVSNYENPMKTFVEVCNSYLFKKILVFDNMEYEFDIRYGGIKQVYKTGTKEDSTNRNIELEELSSGEKQIVSLFSHLMLENGAINYVIIDEPELSLSIDWQKRFLPDIKETPGCVFLGAVTHSPFIFDNNLEKHTVDILEHMS